MYEARGAFVKTTRLGAAIICGGLLAACATSTHTDDAAQSAELLLTSDATHHWGESQLAVNPKNPNNIVYITVGPTDCSQARPGCESKPSSYYPAVPGMPAVGRRQVGFYDRPDFVVIDVYASFDRGRTWQRHSLPQYPVGFPRLSGQGDPSVAAGRDGTFYASWDAADWGSPEKTLPAGGIAVSMSRDGGKTWSGPVLSTTPLDGPKITTDPVTGTVYVHSSTYLGPRSTGNPDTPMGTVSTRWLAHSKDGVHFIGPRSIGGGGGIVAAYGVVASAFKASTQRSPFGDPNAELCGSTPAPCTIFQTSTDEGANWTRHVIAVPSDYSGNPLLAADPSRRGHFAIGLLRRSSAEIHVYQTTDSGVSWTGPVIVTDDASKPKYHATMAYSPNGVLGMVWRTRQSAPAATAPQAAAALPGRPPAPAPYSVWAAISRDGGSTFRQPLKLSKADSPAAPGSGEAGDDYSGVALDRANLYASWADWRPGSRGGYFGAAKFDAFKP
jgi:hypothetical protein